MKVKALTRIANTVDGEKGVGGYRQEQEFDLDPKRAKAWIDSGMVEEVKPEPIVKAPDPADKKQPAAEKKAAKKTAGDSVKI